MSAPVHTTTCRVLYGDTDAAGVVYNANYLRYFEKGRTELMRDWVCSYAEIEKRGIILPVIECFSRFKSPAHYDDILHIETTVDWLKKVSYRFNYRIIRHDKDLARPKLLVKGYTIHASVNQDGKLIQLPEEILEKLQKLAKGA